MVKGFASRRSLRDCNDDEGSREVDTMWRVSVYAGRFKEPETKGLEWGVIKASLETGPNVSCLCTLPTKRNTSPKLLVDVCKSCSM